jgi:hypothetical protein
MTVYGTIGNDNVFLDNAATESTLRRLLQAAEDTADAVTAMAEAAGIDIKKLNDAIEDTVEALEEHQEQTKEGTELQEKENENKKNYAKTMRVVNENLKTFGSIIGDFMNNTVSASGLMREFVGNMDPGIFRTLAQGIQQLIVYQEQNFLSYQKLTNAGITFAGALTDIRVAATASYMTLDQFTDMYAKNSEVFMKLGGNVEEGSRSFSQLSSTMMKSNLGLQLQELGYTFTEINQGMLDYLDITGGVNASELKNKQVVDQLAESSANYMMELDMLARITGKSREELSNNLKKQSQDAAVQSALMGMEKKERDKHVKAMAYATATGIAGAEDYYKSLILGLPPMTEAGRNFAAIMPLAANELVNMAKLAKDGNVENKEFRQSFFALNNSIIRDSKALNDQTKAALIQQGTAAGASIQQMQAYVNKLEQAGDSEEKRAAASAKFMENMERASEQAENMAKFNESLKKLSAAINESFAPLISMVGMGLGALSHLIDGLASGIEWVNNTFPGLIAGVVTVIGTLVVAFKAAAVATAALTAAQNARKSIAGMLGGGGGRGGGGGGGVGKLDRVADGAPLKSLGGGIKSLARGLVAAANPAIIVGAFNLGVAIGLVGAGIGTAIAAIAAGIAAATWLMGNALPTLAKGLSSFAEIDGANLTKVGIGIAALGAGLATMGVGTVAASAGSVLSGLIDNFWGLFGVKSPIEKIKEYANLGAGLQQAATGLKEFTSAMQQLTQLDYDRLARGADALSQIRRNVPNDAAIRRISTMMSPQQVIVNITSPITASQLNTIVPQSISSPAAQSTTPAAVEITRNTALDIQEQMISELKLFNSTARETLSQLRVSGDYHKRTFDVLRGQGSMWGT